MKLKCYGCDEIVTPDCAMAYGGKDWCFWCHEDLGRGFEELERAARTRQQQILDEVASLGRVRFIH